MSRSDVRLSRLASTVTSFTVIPLIAKLPVTLARAAGGSALDAHRRQLLLHAVPDEALGVAGGGPVGAVQRAPADDGGLGDRRRRLGIALEEEVPTPEGERGEQHDQDAHADQDLRQQPHPPSEVRVASRYGMYTDDRCQGFDYDRVR